MSSDNIWRTAGTLVAGVAGAVFFIWPLSTWALVRKLDQPKYTVLKALSKQKSWLHGGYVAEIRQYQPYIIAEVVIQDADIDTALSKGFNKVAKYIFGGNTKKAAGTGAEKVAMTAPVGLEPGNVAEPKGTAEKVAMTAPVGLEPAAAEGSEKVAMTAPVGADILQSGSKKVWFMMPYKYTSIDQLPVPHDDEVKFKQVDAQTLAAVTFNGASPREDKVAEKRKELETLLTDSGVKYGTDLKLWQYHPPFAPPWQRRNEVLLPVTDWDMAAASKS